MATTVVDNDGTRQLPLPSLTYKQWKEQQKDWLPVYDFDKLLRPVKKLKRKPIRDRLWENQTHTLQALHTKNTKQDNAGKDKQLGKTTINYRDRSTKRTSQMYQVFFKTPLDTVVCMQLDSCTTVRTVKKRIAKEIGIQASELRLVTGNFQLCEALTLEDNGVTNESNVEVRIERSHGLPGGADDNPSNCAENSTCNHSPISEKELQEIASDVTEVFGKLATYLGFSNTERHHFQADYMDMGIEQVVFVMLVKWQQRQSKGTPYRVVLATALGKCKRRDLEEKVLAGTLITGGDPDPGELDVNQCQEELRWTYLNSICLLPRYPWDETDCINIDDIYTNLSLLVDQPSPCQVLKIPLEDQNEVFTYQSTTGGVLTRVVIQGDAGTGKSTLMVKFAHDWATNKKDTAVGKFKLLFLLRMRDLNHSSNLEEAIVKHLLAQDTHINALQLKEFIRNKPEECCVVLDGYDEFKHQGLEDPTSGSIIKILNNSILRKCFVVVSSRPAWLAGFGRCLREYRHFEVCGFSKQKIMEYIRRFFGEQKRELADSLVTYLQSNNFDYGLASAPLITQLLCLYWLNGNTNEDSPANMSNEPQVTIGKLYSALFDFLEEHYCAKQPGASEIDLEQLLIKLGKMALAGLSPLNNQLVFTWTEMLNWLTVEDAEKACAIGLLRKQVVSQSNRSLGARKLGRVSSWKKKSTVEFFHKSAQERCAGEYLAHLSEHNLDEFTAYIEKLISVAVALNAKMVLLFACGKSFKTAELILTHLLHLFRCNLEQDMVKYLLGKLRYDRCKCIQDFIDLCLMCNLESESEGRFNEQILQIFSKKKIMFSGITSQRATALQYFLTHLKHKDDINHFMVIGVPAKGTFFMPTETFESTSDRTFHEYLSVYNRLPYLEQQEMLTAFSTKDKAICEMAQKMGIPRSLASMHMWQIFQDWQEIDETSMMTLVCSINPLKLTTLQLRSIHLGESSKVLWDLISNGKLQSLTFLNLRQTGLTKEDVEQLAEGIHCLPNLKHLDICQNQAGEGLDKLSRHLSEVHLRVLNLYRMGAPPKVMTEVHGRLSTFGSSLEKLDLHDNFMNDEGAEILAHGVCQLKHLTHLTLPHPTEVTSIASMQRIFESISSIPQLRIIDISAANFSAQNFLEILTPELAKWQEMKSMRLGRYSNYLDNGNDDADLHQGERFVKAISNMKSLHSLKILRIRLPVKIFETLVLLARQNHYEMLWYSRDCLPEDFISPDDEFIRIV